MPKRPDKFLQDALRRRAEGEIANVLVFSAFHPNYRAYYVWLAMQQPYASAFSHVIETGVLHYFGRDYLSCVHCLVPAIEGILRAHHRAHNPCHGDRISHGELMRFLRSARDVHSYASWHVMYREALADFLTRWLWEHTQEADWDLSFLNRHYILHGMGNEHYYRSQDCHRLFVFLDLYMEMLVLETGVGEHPMIPDDPGIEKRRQHYEDLMMSSERTRPTSARFALLREHPHFHDEPIRESFFERLARWARVMGAD